VFAGIVVTMPCWHGGRECGDDDGEDEEAQAGERISLGIMPSQEDPWLCEEEKATSMPELPAAVSLPPANAVPAEILFCSCLQGCKQEGESTALARQT
jgi:hypothetical protein